MADHGTLRVVREACARAKDEGWTHLAFVPYKEPQNRYEHFENSPQEVYRDHHLLPQGFSIESVVYVPEPIGAAGAECLAGLVGLTSLDLRGNQIGNDGVAHLTRLYSLNDLDLSLNDLSLIPDEIFDLPNLRYLSLGMNPGLGLAAEVLDRTTDPSELRRLLQQAKRGDAARLLACKIVVLGEPEAGKTWLRHRLKSEVPPALKETDDRIETYSYIRVPLRLENVQPPRPHARTDQGEAVRSGDCAPVTVEAFCYDFGGQPSLHHTHRYFLASNRSVIVLCARADRPPKEGRLAYWLSLVGTEHRAHLVAREHGHAVWKHQRTMAPEVEVQRELDARLETLARESGPPVVVVLTCSQKKEAHEQRKEWERAIEDLVPAGTEEVSPITRGPVLVVWDYDSGPLDGAPTNVDEVMKALRWAVERLDEIWRVRLHPGFEELWRMVGEAFGLKEGVPDGKKARRWVKEDPDYMAWFEKVREEWEQRDRVGKVKNEARMNADDERRWLAYLRDAGLVQWIGDWDRTVEGEEPQAAKVLMHPDWVSVPAYAVARPEKTKHAGGVVGDSALNAMLTRAPPARFNVTWDQSPKSDDLSVLRGFMQTVGLIVPVKRPTDARRRVDGQFWLIPELLAPARPPALDEKPAYEITLDGHGDPLPKAWMAQNAGLQVSRGVPRNCVIVPDRATSARRGAGGVTSVDPMANARAKSIPLSATGPGGEPVAAGQPMGFLPDYALLPVIAALHADRASDQSVFRDLIELRISDPTTSGEGTSESKSRALIRLLREGHAHPVAIEVQAQDSASLVRLETRVGFALGQPFDWGTSTTGGLARWACRSHLETIYEFDGVRSVYPFVTSHSKTAPRAIDALLEQLLSSPGDELTPQHAAEAVRKAHTRLLKDGKDSPFKGSPKLKEHLRRSILFNKSTQKYSYKTEEKRIVWLAQPPSPPADGE